MKLHLTDYFLEACRVMKAVLDAGRPGGDAGKDCFIVEEGKRVELSREGMEEKFGEFLDKTERLIAETGYYQRDGELAELKKWAGEEGW